MMYYVYRQAQPMIRCARQPVQFLPISLRCRVQGARVHVASRANQFPSCPGLGERQACPAPRKWTRHLEASTLHSMWRGGRTCSIPWGDQDGVGWLGSVRLPALLRVSSERFDETRACRGTKFEIQNSRFEIRDSRFEKFEC